MGSASVQPAGAPERARGRRQRGGASSSAETRRSKRPSGFLLSSAALMVSPNPEPSSTVQDKLCSPSSPHECRHGRGRSDGRCRCRLGHDCCGLHSSRNEQGESGSTARAGQMHQEVHRLGGVMHPNTGTGDHASFPLRTPCFHLFTKARAEQAHQELMTGLRRVEVLQEGNSDELL